jgi:hypothetical protein
MGIILLAAYMLAVPFLIWGWVSWLKSKQRFVPPAWRGVLAFIALTLVSAIGLPLFFAAIHARGMPEGPAKYSFLVMVQTFGVGESIFTLALALVGKGPARLPVACSSLCFAVIFQFANPYL